MPTTLPAQLPMFIPTTPYIGDGELTREEYVRRKQNNEAEIARWEARTTDSERLARELTMCVETFTRVTQTWVTASTEDRQGMVRILFESITYDLTTQRITDFKLKAWAEKYVVLPEALYELETGEREQFEKETESNNESSSGQDDTDGNFALETGTPPSTDGFLRFRAIYAPTVSTGHKSLQISDLLAASCLRLIAV